MKIGKKKETLEMADSREDNEVDSKSTGLSLNQMMGIIDTCYNAANNGIPKVSKSVDEMAEDYLLKYGSAENAAKSLINYQIAKCATSGFLTGFGGFITLPVTIPANISSVMYVQMRMVAAIARIGGYDQNSDQVQTLVYACLTGKAMTDVLKDAGIKVGTKMAKSGIQKISGAALKKINQKVGFRFITKFWEKGVINLGKMIPVVGAAIGSGFDFASTKIIAHNAYKMFIESEVSE